MPPSAAKNVTDAGEVRAAEQASYTRDAVSERPDLTIVGDAVYDAKAFRSEHPGGAHFVNLFGGRDATEAFMEYHRRAWPKARMSKFFKGSLAPAEKPVQADEGYLKLCAEVNELLPKGSGGFAPWSYWLKAALIFGSAVAVEGYMLLHGKSLSLSLALGVLFAWIGLNIQHDANHGSLSRKAWVNFACGLTQDWIGGNMILWLQEHVVMHHLHTNDVDKDPDQKAHGVLRLKPTDGWLPWHLLQHVYILPGEAAYGFKLLFLDAIELLAWRWEGESISKLAGGMYAPSILLKLAFWARFVALPLFLEPTLWTLLCLSATICSGSFYLAFFFFISHNFEGVGSVGPQGSLPRNATFVQRQVETSSNVAGAKLAVVNGGLNYQIEHHLFPRLHHSYYSIIAPVVKKAVEGMGYKYVHFPTIGDNLGSMFRHMHHMGQKPAKVAKAE
mmetsp:Transcript_6811/g.19845  ORF Transcript_6811/g.19845 Transcript_6811/m.19845 type:complete len:445 (+) Transcript_6811:79-1413(+)